MQSLPKNIYTVAQTRELDRLAIEEFGLAGSILMARAADAVFKVMLTRWPKVKKIAVVCGVGNNAGDGLVLARLAAAQQIAVTVLLVGKEGDFTGEALEAYTLAQGTRAVVKGFAVAADELRDVDVVVDALFGSGLKQTVTGRFKEAIDRTNSSGVPILSIDIPSGLNGDTGAPLGVAVKADSTVCLVGLKLGLLTGFGPDYVGELFFSDLSVPLEVYARVASTVVRVQRQDFLSLLPRRPRTAHKGFFGHVLVVGGNVGMGGAALLAGEGALRVGAGLVSLATHPQHATNSAQARPELMVNVVADGKELVSLIKSKAFTVIAVGPGLGQTPWSQDILAACLQSHQLVVDADALNLLAKSAVKRNDWILTPHAAEAGRLLQWATPAVQRDRLRAVRELQKKYGGVVVLKGVGTLIDSGVAAVSLCAQGNPGMAVAGMGDCLTGVIAGLVAQGLPLPYAAQLGVCVHAEAGDLAAKEGERGLITSDLFAHIHHLVNS